MRLMCFNRKSSWSRKPSDPGWKCLYLSHAFELLFAAAVWTCAIEPFSSVHEAFRLLLCQTRPFLNLFCSNDLRYASSYAVIKWGTPKTPLQSLIRVHMQNSPLLAMCSWIITLGTSSEFCCLPFLASNYKRRSWHVTQVSCPVTEERAMQIYH